MIKNFTNWFRIHRIHFVVWSVFIIWEVVVIGMFSGVFGHPLNYAFHYLLIIAVFYIHASRALPWALVNLNQSIWRIPLVALMEITAFILCSYIVDKGLIWAGSLQSQGPLVLNLQYTLRTLYRELYFLGFATGYYYLTTYLKEKMKTSNLERRNFRDIIKRQKAEKETAKAQNAFLMAQINPHFFFNTLDYLYHNVMEVSPKSAEAIEILATMMRFSTEADKFGEYIRLEDEIEQVQNLIYLNQLREPLAIILAIDNEAVGDIYLIPLVLLTLAENIFKHGNLKSKADRASIRIWLTEDDLCIETDNLINEKYSSLQSHTGLTNMAKRLNYAYGDNIQFSYGSHENGQFKVSLAIPLSLLTFGGTFLYPSTDTDTK
jgi:two-component system LytT family sensor kinase